MNGDRFPTSEYKDRWERVRAACREKGYDAVVVFSRGGAVVDSYADILYLINHYHPFVFSNDFPNWWIGRAHAALVLTMEGDPSLVVDVTDWRRDLVKTPDVRFDFDVPGTVIKVLRERGLGNANIALVGGNAMTASVYRHLLDDAGEVSFTNDDKLVETVRIRKSPLEQQAIRDAVSIGNRVMEAMMTRALEPGVTEAQCITAGLSIAMENCVAVYDAACASGPMSFHYAHGRLPSWTDRKLEAGDFFHVDTYGALDGYLYDFSRTAVCGGKPSADQQRILDAAVEAVDAGVTTMKPGVPAKDIYHAVRNVLDGHGMVGEGLGGDYTETPALCGSFPAHGHAIGLFWDPPWLLPDEEMLIEPGMAFGIELMAGLPGVGAVKCEQNVIVTETGCELLTTIPKYFV
ncbi:MAG: Xaa-Pro peptidase family protein [Pseudomonadota bacterium]